MTRSKPSSHRFAVIADPHVFDLFPGYGIEGVAVDGRAGAAVHTLADSAISTRLFNEGYFALPAALDQCAAHGLRTVLIAGDLSDDGQQSAMSAAVSLLKDYEARHGMRFFLTPGNHDAHGMSGRDITRRLLDPEGGFITVGSGAPPAATSGPYLQESGQRCGTYPELLAQWARFGLKRHADDLHWECPFGRDDRPEQRMFTLRSPDGRSEHRQLDLSYLVEPEEGLWLLSIDANIYAPRDGYACNDSPDAFEDSTAAGWPALVRHKPFLLDWMADAARRASAGGKTLICFSHYPMIDPLDGTLELERALFGETMSARRTPSADISRRLCATGVSRHFSGHMHIYDRASIACGGNTLTNYAMPSLAAFPPVLAVAEADQDTFSLQLEYVELQRHRALFPAYRAEMARNGETTTWLAAETYADYTLAQIGEQVTRRQLRDEWPEPLRSFQSEATLADAAAVLGLSVGSDAEGDDFSLLPMQRFFIDLHALRMGSEIAIETIPSSRLEAYRHLLSQIRDQPLPEIVLGRQLHMALFMFERFATANHALAWTERGS